MISEIILTVPNLQGQGGVASYYNSVLPYLKKSNFCINTLEIGSWGKERNILQPLQDQFAFRRSCNRKKALVHINPSFGSKSFWRDGFFAWQAKQKGHRLLVFFRGWDHDFVRVSENKFLRFFKNTYGRADSFIVLASEFKEKLREWGVTVPIYVETTTVDDELIQGLSTSVTKNYFISNRQQTHILFLSRLEREKGVFEMLEALQLLQSKKLNVSLSIAGDGEAKREVDTYIRKNGLSDHCHSLGFIRGKDKIKAFMSHDIYCLPTSYGEGLPNSVLEAMAFGLPVVTTSVGGLKDFFKNGRMGLLMENITSENIATTIEQLITQPELMTQISKYNNTYAKENLMASKVANKLLAIYKNVSSAYGVQ